MSNKKNRICLHIKRITRTNWTITTTKIIYFLKKKVKPSTSGKAIIIIIDIHPQSKKTRTNNNKIILNPSNRSRFVSSVFFSSLIFELSSPATSNGRLIDTFFFRFVCCVFYMIEIAVASFYWSTNAHCNWKSERNIRQATHIWVS